MRGTAPILRSSGFTLVEMSLVLIVIGLIAMTVYPAVTSLLTAMQRNQTDNNLQTLLRATAVYVQANGCVPCPSPANGVAIGIVRGDSSASPAACDVCSTPEGLAPFASLGVPQNVAKDGWGRWIRMRVDPALTVAFNVVPPTALCTTNDSNCTPGTSSSGLCSNGLTSVNRVSVRTAAGVTQQAAVIFLSHGANGTGAPAPKASKQTYAFPASATTCAAGNYERCNANDAGDSPRPSFVQATQTGGTMPFDDSMVFVDRNNLVSLLGNGSCQTVW